VALQRGMTVERVRRTHADVSNTTGAPEPYGSAFGMELGGDREVEAVVLAGIQPPQELETLLKPPFLRSDGVCSAQCQIVHRTGSRLAGAELRDRAGKILVDGDLDAWHRRWHDQ
jgi:hypothetical protein